MQRQILDSCLILNGQLSGAQALSQHSKVVCLNASSALCRFKHPSHTPTKCTVNMSCMWVLVCWDAMAGKSSTAAALSAGPAVVVMGNSFYATFNLLLASRTLRSCLECDQILSAWLKCPVLLNHIKLCCSVECSKVLLSHYCVSSWGISTALPPKNSGLPMALVERGRFEWGFNLTSTNKQPRQQC